MNGPLPSVRAFLCDLPSLPAGTKVRFLGCVRSYHTPTGYLLLEHNCPRGKAAYVAVDINAVLDSVTPEELRVGSWIHVLGYVRRVLNKSDAPFGKKFAGPVYVDAVVVFSAGAIALGDYERILRDAQEVDRRVARPV